jgi:hypothetical protein
MNVSIEKPNTSNYHFYKEKQNLNPNSMYIGQNILLLKNKCIGFGSFGVIYKGINFL